MTNNKYYVIKENNLLIGNKSILESLYVNLSINTLPNDYVENKYIVQNNILVLNPNFEKEEETKREENFKNNFFKIKDACWFRKQPKGYNSAIESLNTAFNVVSVLGKLPANTLTFYIAPDFSIEGQCTENWLVKNSYKNEEMTPQEFGEFYASFMTAWNNEEHK
jgi:hypothetical protein